MQDRELALALGTTLRMSNERENIIVPVKDVSIRRP